MYITHSKFGIGEVIENNGNMITVYFDEVEQTKSLIAANVTIYATIEEAEMSLNTEMSNEEKEAYGAELQNEADAYKRGQIATAWLRNYNSECSKNLMRNI
jgi:hypothetical protein